MKLDLRGAVAYVATGNQPIDKAKETVVFIHGVGQDHTVWVLPIRYFARHGRNVLAVDLPGHGRSGGQPLKTIEEMADWVVDLLDACNIEEAAIVGHSMGSLVALDLAARHPGRARSLALVGVSVPLAVNEQLLGRAETESHDAIEMLTYWGHSKWSQIGGSPTPGIWMTGVSMRLWERAAPGTVHNDLSACDDYSVGLERAEQVMCPTLLLLGEKDVMTPLRVAQNLARLLENQETVVFEGAGHALLAERPDPVLDELARIV
jgi:pimeloyl-ACP methyl ester carboxylesterase